MDGHLLGLPPHTANAQQVRERESIELQGTIFNNGKEPRLVFCLAIPALVLERDAHVNVTGYIVHSLEEFWNSEHKTVCQLQYGQNIAATPCPPPAPPRPPKA